MKCPAKCVKGKKCYGESYFNFKPRPAKECDEDNCNYPEELKEFMDRKDKRYY